MGTRKYDKKELLLKILQAEKARQEKINNLKLELHELEMQGDMCDTDRIDEIIKELNILDPLPEKEEDEKENKISQAVIKIKKKRRFILLKVASIIGVVLLCIQVLGVTAFHRNFFDDAINWSQDMYYSLIGKNMQEDDKKVEASGAKQYNSVEEFEKAENIKILTPEYMPNNIKIESVVYFYDFEEKNINIVYDDNMTSLIVKLNERFPDINNIDNAYFYEKGGIIFYVFKYANMILWEYENNFYNFNFGFDIDEYEKIIKSIK